MGAGDSGRPIISFSFSSSPPLTASGGEGGAPFIEDTEGEGEGDSMRSRSRSRLVRPGDGKVTRARSASTTTGPLAMVDGGTGRRNGEDREPRGVDEDEDIVASLLRS